MELGYSSVKDFEYFLIKIKLPLEFFFFFFYSSLNQVPLSLNYTAKLLDRGYSGEFEIENLIVWVVWKYEI